MVPRSWDLPPSQSLVAFPHRQSTTRTRPQERSVDSNEVPKPLDVIKKTRCLRTGFPKLYSIRGLSRHFNTFWSWNMIESVFLNGYNVALHYINPISWDRIPVTMVISCYITTTLWNCPSTRPKPWVHKLLWGMVMHHSPMKWESKHSACINDIKWLLYNSWTFPSCNMGT